MTDTQLNRYIADLRARRRQIAAQLDEALEEWTHRHGADAGTCISAGGVTIRLVPQRRWDPELADAFFATRPDLRELVTTTGIDRERAREVLEEDDYVRCQRTLPTPRTLVELDDDPVNAASGVPSAS